MHGGTPKADIRGKGNRGVIVILVHIIPFCCRDQLTAVPITATFIIPEKLWKNVSSVGVCHEVDLGIETAVESWFEYTVPQRSAQLIRTRAPVMLEE